jgi:hypothetical protein
MKRWIMAACAAAALFGAQAQAEERCGAELHMRSGETRAYFRDVLGACRRDGYCSAVVALPDRSGGGAAWAAQLRIARPLAGEPYQVEVAATTPMPASTPVPMKLVFARTQFALDAGATQSISGNEYRLADQTIADAVVQSAKAARNLRWTYQGEGGPATATFPLNGMTAALTWIDCMTAQPAH